MRHFLRSVFILTLLLLVPGHAPAVDGIWPSTFSSVHTGPARLLGGGPPSEGLLLYAKGTTDSVGVSVSDYSLIGSTWQPVFFDSPTEPKTDVTAADVLADANVNQVNVFGTAARGVAIYDISTSEAVLTKALQWARQFPSGYCIANAVAAWGDQWSDDGTQLKDLSTTATHEATPGISLYIDVTYSITFAGMDAEVTIVSHGGTATVSLSSGTLTCSVAGSLFDILLSDGTFYACNQNTGNKILPNENGDIEGVLVGFTLDDDWIESALYGSTKHNELGYSVGVTTNVHLIENEADREFTSDTGFWVDNNVVISGGVATFNDPTVCSLSKYTFLTIGKTYYVRLGISRRTVGGINVNGSGGFDSVGDHVYTFTAASDSLIIYRQSGATDLDLDYFYIEELPQGYIPASLTNPTEDIYGNDLTYSGRAAQPLDVFGYTVGWDGVTYGVTNYNLGSTEFYDFEMPVSTSSFAADMRPLGGSNDSFSVRMVSTTSIRIYYGDGSTTNSVTYSGVPTISETPQIYRIKVNRVTGEVELFVDGVSQGTKSGLSLPGSFTQNLSIGASGTGTGDLVGIMPWVKRYDSVGNLTNYWIVESGSQLTQGTIYDVVGGNHATMSGATTPAFDTLLQPSYLAQYGGEVSGQNIIPYPLGTNTFNSIHDAPPGDTFVTEVLPTPEMVSADPLNERIDVGGNAISADPTTYTNNANWVQGLSGIVAAGGIGQDGVCEIKSQEFSGVE